MPKLSVSIPDELWEQATRLAGESKKASQIIQDALRHEVSEREDVRTSLVGGEDVVSPERFNAVVATVRAVAQGVYRSGYERGLDYVEQEGYAGLRFGRLVDWEVEEVLGAAEEPESWVENDYYEELMDESNEIFRDGFVRALQECWQAIRAAGPVTVLSDDEPDATEISEPQAEA